MGMKIYSLWLGEMEEASGNDYLRRNVNLMTVGNTAIVSVNSLWIMFMPFFFSDIGLDVVTIGLVFSLFAASSASASPIGGRIADRIGRKPTLLIGYTIYSSGPLVILLSLFVSSQSLPLAALVSVIGYAGMMAGRGFARPASSILLVESSQEKKKGRSYMVATRVLPSIPAAVLVLIGSELYFSGTSLQSSQFPIALIIGFLGIFSVICAYGLLLKESYRPVERKEIPKPQSVWKSELWFFILVVIAFSLDAVSSSGLSPYVPNYVRPIDDRLYGYLISVSTLIIAVSALGAGEIVDRLGLRTALSIGWGLLAITVAIFPLFTDPILILVLYAVWAGLDMMDVSIPPLVIESKYPKEVRATVLGTFSTVVSLGSIAGPALVSLALLFGDAIPFFMKAAMNFLGLLLFLIATKSVVNLNREDRRKEVE
jgi:MFS family permease